MKNRDTNKLVMFLALATFCAAAKNQEAVGHLAPFQESWNAFRSLVNRLRKRSTSLLKLNPTGSTENSLALRQAIAKRAAAISAALVTWARKTGKPDVAEQAHVTKSMLLNGRAIDAVERAEHLVELEDEHLDALEAYKINKQVVTTLDDLITEFSENIGRPRAIIKARKQVRQTLPDLLAKAEIELGHMDRLLVLLEDDFEEFVQGYRVSRKIDQVSASRALSELEKANAAVREAKQEVVKAKSAAEIDGKHEEAKTTLAKARAIHPGTGAKAKAGVADRAGETSQTTAESTERVGLDS